MLPATAPCAGFEGVLSSFPPLPGDSIVKRDRSDNVETIARVLKRDGYASLFFYGGRGLFDDMRSFALRNGYDRFIEEKHFEHPTFSTIWGVCDEDLYRRGDRGVPRRWRKTGQPFFATDPLGLQPQALHLSEGQDPRGPG